MNKIKLSIIYGKDEKTIANWVNRYKETGRFLERRAINVSQNDICRFVEEVDSISWIARNNVFFDKINFDYREFSVNVGMHCEVTNSLSVVNLQENLASLCYFLSILMVLLIISILMVLSTEQLFTRCQNIANSISVRTQFGFSMELEFTAMPKLSSFYVKSELCQYSFWQYYFGYVKKSFQRHCTECSPTRSLITFVIDILGKFEDIDLTNVFQHCGWLYSGRFDPCRGRNCRQIRLELL
ncbi:hypothetical protein THRCLA_23089, partial [Thraustotheca clavata]